MLLGEWARLINKYSLALGCIFVVSYLPTCTFLGTLLSPDRVWATGIARSCIDDTLTD